MSDIFVQPRLLGRSHNFVACAFVKQHQLFVIRCFVIIAQGSPAQGVTMALAKRVWQPHLAKKYQATSVTAHSIQSHHAGCYRVCCLILAAWTCSLLFWTPLTSSALDDESHHPAQNCEHIGLVRAKFFNNSTIIETARAELDSIGLSYQLPYLDQLKRTAGERQGQIEKTMNDRGDISIELSLEYPLEYVLAFGNHGYVYKHFPIVIGRASALDSVNKTAVGIYVNAVEQLVGYYGLQMIFDTDQSRRLITDSLLDHPYLHRYVKFVFNHHFPWWDSYPGKHPSVSHFLSTANFNATFYMMDYSPLYNRKRGFLPAESPLAERAIATEYANMPMERFLEQTHQANSSEHHELEQETVSILNSGPYILVCGSNRRDYSGAVVAAEKLGIWTVIAEKNLVKFSHLESLPLVRVVKVPLLDFNVLLTNALFVVVPAAIPPSTPVGIGTLARTRMARKIPIAVNNTGTNFMISHGLDGFLVPDPTAEHERGHGSYESIFRTLATNDTYRSQLEQNIDTMRNTEEIAGPALVRKAACIATEAMTGTPIWTLHHVRTCQQCGREWCDSWTVNLPNVGIEGRFRLVGNPLDVVGCGAIREAAMVEVVRNSESEMVYVALACRSTNTS